MRRSFEPALYVAEPNGPFAESVRQLRTSIIHQVRLGRQSYLVTSSWKSEGKSMLCLNLAISLAETGLSILLVDGDLRTRALTNWIFPDSRDSSWAVRATPWSDVSFLGGPPALDLPPGDLLIQPEFKMRVTEAFTSYSVVLVDSPALEVCGDALLLGRWVDVAIMAVCKRRFRGVPEGNFAEDLRASGVHLLGSVLT